MNENVWKLNAKVGQNLFVQIQSTEIHMKNFSFVLSNATVTMIRVQIHAIQLIFNKLIFERLKIESYRDVSVTRIGESVSWPCSGPPYKLPERSSNTEIQAISPFRLSCLLALPARILAKW